MKLVRITTKVPNGGIYIQKTYLVAAVDREQIEAYMAYRGLSYETHPYYETPVENYAAVTSDLDHEIKMAAEGRI